MHIVLGSGLYRRDTTGPAPDRGYCCREGSDAAVGQFRRKTRRLILGRFGGGGLDVLRSIAANLTTEKYLPIIFNFDRPEGRNYTETIKILVGLSRFVIVDLSGPSVPQELYATVPHFKIPFVPIIEKGRKTYSMFRDLEESDWVLKPPVEFASKGHLIEMMPSRVITPAEKMYKQRQASLRRLFNP